MIYPRIRALRKDAGLTQAEFADILNIQRTTYTRYESGDREITLKLAILIASYHKVSLDYLAGIAPEPNNRY